MQLSVIILNYNVRYFLELCLQSVTKAVAGLDAEIIVVDNNSPDDSCAVVKANYPHIKLIALDDNLGFPKGNNIGVAAAKGEFICILNPDTVVPENTFSKLLEFSKDKPELGIVGVKMIDGSGRFLPESKRGVPTPWVAITKVAGLYKIFPKSKLFNQYYAMHLGENEQGATEILTGAFMFMRRDVYTNAGGFDESYFMYSEDMDLSYTVHKAGKQNYYFPGVTIIHFKGESTIRDKAYMKRFNDATKAFYRKHFNRSLLFDAFMQAGTLFFVFKKAKSQKVAKSPDEYLLFSANDDLKEGLEGKLGKKVIRLTEYKDTMLHNEVPGKKIHKGVIFDADTLDYQDIIAIMCKHNAEGYIYRIQPHDKRFVTGSDSSNDRGVVIKV